MREDDAGKKDYTSETRRERIESREKEKKRRRNNKKKKARKGKKSVRLQVLLTVKGRHLPGATRGAADEYQRHHRRGAPLPKAIKENGEVG